jgi:hypothetical protein
MAKVQAPNIQLQDQDSTSTQGFESADKNIIWIYPGDCPHCLRPFNSPSKKGTIVNVITNFGKDQWCYECATEGEKNGICILESKLSKDKKKLWEKWLKKK